MSVASALAVNRMWDPSSVVSSRKMMSALERVMLSAWMREPTMAPKATPPTTLIATRLRSSATVSVPRNRFMLFSCCCLCQPGTWKPRLVVQLHDGCSRPRPVCCACRYPAASKTASFFLNTSSARLPQRSGTRRPATLYNAATLASLKGQRIPKMGYLCMPGGYFWRRTSENSPKAKFAELIFHKLR